MDQNDRRQYLIKYLLSEQGDDMPIPSDEQRQRRLLRSLFNIRMPNDASEEFLSVQNEYLKEETAKKGIVDISSLTPVQQDIYLWQGDITTLRCDAVVNAANSQMLGCFQPCHGCIDNVIHTYAGIQLRSICNEIMTAQGSPEPTGKAKITPAYNLPSRYVIHTVGPIVNGRLTDRHCELLRSCYLSCLKLADENELDSIAFCCISTGVFGFPQKEAAKIAIQTVKDYKTGTNSKIKVIFNVFKNDDLFIYNSLLK